MKFLVIASLLSFALACQAETAAKKEKLPVNKGAEFAKTLKKGEVKEPDCDEKAKKPVEIKQETLSLSGNTGCSLDEIK